MKYRFQVLISLYLTAGVVGLAAQTAADYSGAFTEISQENIGLRTPQVAFTSRGLAVKKLDSGLTTRQEFVRDIGKNGLETVHYLFAATGDKPLYEMIFEFDNADTLQQLLIDAFGPPSHPTLDDHWLLSRSPEGIVTLLWRYEKKLVIAANLPETELQDEPAFNVSADLFAGNDDEAPAPDAAAPEIGEWVIELNLYLQSATKNNFSDLKGAPVDGRKGEFTANTPFDGATETVLRQNADGNWQLEARHNFDNLEDARNLYSTGIANLFQVEGLQYRLKHQTEYSTNTGMVCVWQVLDLNGKPTGTKMVLRLATLGNSQYTVNLEIGKN